MVSVAPSSSPYLNQKIAQHIQKCHRVERLFHERADTAALYVRLFEVVAVAGIHDNRQIGPDANELAREIEACAFGHRVVGDYNIESPGVTRKCVAGLR